MARGGRRSGAPGKAYGERTDLNVQRAPVAIPGQQRYGAQADQLRAQQAVPTGPTPAPRVAATVSGAASPQGSPAAPTPIVPLGAPTMRPDEPLTAGVNVGPGPGAPAGPPSTVGDLLRSLSATSPETAELLDYLLSGGQ